MERWFTSLTERRIRRGTHLSTRELEQAIRAYVQRNNGQPKPFAWTKTADVIVGRTRKTTSVPPYIVSMSPPGYPSGWLRPRIARFRFARQDRYSSAASCGLNFQNWALSRGEAIDLRPSQRHSTSADLCWNRYGNEYNTHMGQQTAWILTCLLVVALAIAASSGFAGTWEGTENGLPSVELTIQNRDAGITGSIGFYFQTRGTDGKWHLGEKYTVPLLSPKLEGRALSFETIHHKCHGCTELGPNDKYRVDFVGAKEARLRILRDQKEDGLGLKLTRRE